MRGGDAHIGPPRTHRAPGWRVERQVGRGWAEVGPAWDVMQACRLMATRRGHGERVRIVDCVTGRVDVDVRPGEHWEYEMWR